jgi:hypothetical protein
MPSEPREVAALARRLFGNEATEDTLRQRVRKTRDRVREIYDTRLPDGP